MASVLLCISPKENKRTKNAHSFALLHKLSLELGLDLELGLEFGLGLELGCLFQNTESYFELVLFLGFGLVVKNLQVINLFNQAD